MPSMSYCRLENLLKDVDAVLGAFDEEEYTFEDGKLVDEYGDEYSDYEQNAAKNLPALLRELADRLED